MKNILSYTRHSNMVRLLVIFLAGTLIQVSAKAQTAPPDPVETDTLAPFVTTGGVFRKEFYADLGGAVTSDGGSPVTERGVVYSTTNQLPTVGDTKVIMGSGIGSFNNRVFGLTGGTVYYYRAYAINSIGTSYGIMIAFQTLHAPAIVKTNEVTNITDTSATVGGIVVSDGGSDIFERGVYYSTVDTFPSQFGQNSIKLPIGTGFGSFSQNIVGLTPGVTYYIQAYANNGLIQTTGGVIRFTPGGASVTTNTPTAFGTNSVTLGGTIISANGSSVTERGIVYVTGNAVPTIADTKVVMGSGGGAFSQNIGSLLPATTYTARAYATNAKGTNYGSTQSFITQTSIVSISRVGAVITNKNVVSFSVVFAQSITGLMVDNFSLSATGVVNPYVTAVSGSGTIWNVTVYTGRGSGTLRLNLANTTGITPLVGNLLPFAGEVYIIDKTAPILTSVSISSNNTNTGRAKTGDIVTVSFTANETIITPTLIVAGRSLTPVNTNGNTWTGATTMVAGDIEGPINSSIGCTDIAGNVGITSTTTTDNTNVTFDKTAPVVNSISLASSNNSTANYTVQFSENVTGVDVADFGLTVATLPNPSIVSVSGSGSTYNVIVSVGTGNGTIRLDLKNSGTGIADLAGNAIETGFNSGQIFLTKPILKITDPAAVCAPGTVNLTAAAVTAGSDAGQSFSYFSDAAATQVLSNPAAVSVSGRYFIRGNVGAAISDVLAVNVTINPLPSENILAPLGTILCGTTATLTLNVTGPGAGNTYVWSKDGTTISGATANVLSVTNAVGVYAVTITTAAGCSASAGNKITITLVQAPKAAFVNDTYCTSVPVNFTNISTVTGSGTVTNAWSDNAGNTSALSAPSFTYSSAGNYTVKLKVTPAACPALADSMSKTIAIEVPTPAARLPLINANMGDQVQLQARTFGTTYTWTPNTGLSSATIVNPTTRVDNETQYTIKTVAASGCTTVDTLLVRVFSESVYVPNVFTPNGDGLNDKLFVNLIGMKQLLHFTVYNRYGKKVFETANSTEGWDGNVNGVKQPLDTYVWIVEGIDKNGNSIQTRGTVTLIR